MARLCLTPLSLPLLLLLRCLQELVVGVALSVLELPFVCSTALLARFEALSLPFLANIWRRRASILNGVPSLDLKGESVVLSQLREDGRCRSFAVGSVVPAGSSAADSNSSFQLVSVRSLGSPRCL